MTDFHTLIRHILNAHGGENPLCSFDVSDQFVAGSGVQKTTAAFLVILAGTEHPHYVDAQQHLAAGTDAYAGFLRDGLARVEAEISERIRSDSTFAGRMTEAAQYAEAADTLVWDDATRTAIWQVFFPEGVDFLDDPSADVVRLREKRRVVVTQVNGRPLSDPAAELLFTSNILLTVPSSEDRLQQAGLAEDLNARIRDVVSEQQLFWFDHPIQIGIEPDRNEAIYGLRGLNGALAFEKARGTMAGDARATCVLSVSVTHQGLHHVTNDYLNAEFAKIEPLEHLKIYVFTERATAHLISDVLVPAAAALLPDRDASILTRVFGVDGEYGRHYSFLKAIAALWQVLIDDRTRATFKIDLDQVFPQDVLVETTGMSAFEHYMTPLWGAEGTDSAGNKVELGMIAGALVNEKDIDQSLYAVDVPFPSAFKNNDGVFFMSGLPMAGSTEAEMGTRYGHDGIDGTDTCIQRVHVTGGTNGILVDALRRHRPFTPTFIGRAEDQAYILSVLFSGNDANLRYVHRDGLIMRHDKHAFAGEAIEAAAVGRQTGDLVRLLYFSNYARCLPWPLAQTKEAVDPFTGCFISELPVTLVMLRLCLSVAEMCEQGDPLSEELTAVAVQRLGEAFGNMDLSDDYADERAAWDLYYDILNAVESAGPEMDIVRQKASELVAGCRIDA